MQSNDTLLKFTMAAKAVLANPDRLEALIKMAQTKPGAITAVHTVMQAIELRAKIPEQIKPILGMNIYMLIVDAAQHVMGKKADPNVMRGVVSDIVKSITSGQPVQPQARQAPQATPAAPTQPQQAPMGLIAQAGA